MEWRTRLEGLLQGRQSLTPEEVSDHHQCAFGQWYFGHEGEKFNKEPVFALVGDHHEKVHDYALRIVRHHQKGEQETAHSLMAEFEEQREHLFSNLDELYLL